MMEKVGDVMKWFGGVTFAVLIAARIFEWWKLDNMNFTMSIIMAISVSAMGVIVAMVTKNLDDIDIIRFDGQK